MTDGHPSPSAPHPRYNIEHPREGEQKGGNILHAAATGKVTMQGSLQLRSLLSEERPYQGSRERHLHMLKAALSPGLYKGAVKFP